jgi:malate dehydrogenase (oxaloacetate-decarboxylating)(NADP+)
MNENKNLKEEALKYHEMGRPGKIEVIPTKPHLTQRDLSLAYSPGVAEPCLKIHEDPANVYRYTAKGNLVAVISNGTAVLGLGNLGPEAAKPVMEGKGLLFKIFADIDVFDIELNCTTVDEFVATVKALEPTFGGINLEDIKAPECFEIERQLKEKLNIPVMHDDQHGTAIISGAALLNAAELVGKPLDTLKMVVNGAGASAISCTRIFISLGVKKENIVMLDSKGVLRKDDSTLDENKTFFATDRNIHTLEEALQGADVFIGLSKGNILTPAMLLGMAANPIVFAMANPDPEIDYSLAVATRSDIIMATGRSDFPNQVNNVLGFPFIFRGALDVRATAINEEMKLAAVRALANLAKEPVPDKVMRAYNEKNMTFSRNYIIPKPIDDRLIYTVAPAVAKAAMDSGVARQPITDWEAYEATLKDRMGLENKLMNYLTVKARKDPKKVVFAEADNQKILRAAHILKEEGIAKPILLGNNERIKALIAENNLDLDDCPIIEPFLEKDKQEEFGNLLFEKRQRKGMNAYEARKAMRDRNYYGCMMVETGEADAFISGLTKNYATTIVPALQVLGMRRNVNTVAGMYIINTKKGPLFLADATVNLNPTAEELVQITLLAAEEIKRFNIVPKIALLSYSNFGSAKGDTPRKTAEAVRILHAQHPDLIVDGDIQANVALNNDLMKDNFPFSKLVDQGVNALIFPNLESGNIAYKLLQEAGGMEAIGPILLGMRKPVHILQLGSDIREIVSMVTIAVVDAQDRMEGI